MVVRNIDFDFTRWHISEDFIGIMDDLRRDVTFRTIHVPIAQTTSTEGIPTNQPPIEVKMSPKKAEGDLGVFTVTFRPKEDIVIRVLCQAHDVYTVAYEANGKWNYHPEFKDVFEATSFGATAKKEKGKGKQPYSIPFDCNYPELTTAADMDRSRLQLGKRELIKALKALHTLEELRNRNPTQARIVQALAIMTITHMVPECLRFGPLMYHVSDPELPSKLPLWGKKATTDWDKFCDYIAECRKNEAYEFEPVNLMKKEFHPFESTGQTIVMEDMGIQMRKSWPPSTIKTRKDLLDLVLLIKYDEEIMRLEVKATQTEREILQTKGLSKRGDSGSLKFKNPEKASQGSTGKDTRGTRSSSDKGKGTMRQQTGVNHQVTKLSKSIGVRLVEPLFRVLKRAVSACGIPAACEKSPLTMNSPDGRS
ncbi:hypothetical protein Tsubulata_049778 [Turnera subulata]|uniref:Uncharacterized protein n=1 Tax=Turnera subulata TaxID=218843 RepID=A0A9Q0F5H1_9ROSI|nr:hypothetical protein Tsubulata_049778 [Turnera subulata]